MFGWPLSELYGVRRCFPKVWEASFFECYQLSQEEYVTMLILDQCFRKIAKENKKWKENLKRNGNLLLHPLQY